MKERLRIAYLGIIDITAEAAETRHVFEICENWQRLGHEVTLFVPQARGEPSQKVSIQIIRMRTFGLKKSFLLTFIYNFASVFYLLKQFSSEGIDIIYTRQSMLEFIPLFFMKPLGVRYVAEVNGIDSEQKRFYGLAEWKIQLSETLYSICYKLADSVVAVTDGIREYLNERYPATRAKTFVTSNGANIDISRPLEKIAACGELGLDPDRIYLAFVGSLKKWHGIENAISVAERLIENNDGIRLLVLGDGPERPFLRNVVAKKGLEKRVTFLGKVKYDQVPLYIGTATACLALYNRKSNDRSGLRPLKIFEYMACGRPVVTTDVGNLRSVIGKHKCGLIVEPGDLDAMSEAVMSLVRNPDLARELGENGRKAAVRYYSWRAISEELVSILYAASKKS